MQEYRTRALVLQVYDHGESDRLVHLYSEELGRVSAIAKGARRSKKRFPGMLEILSVLEVRLVDPPRASLMRLEDAVLITPFERFVGDLSRFVVSCQLLELLDRFTGEREANPELFGFGLGVLDVIASEDADSLLALLVLTKTLGRLGYRPQLIRCVRCGAGIEGGRVAFVPRDGGVACAPCGAGEPLWVPARQLRLLDHGIRIPLRERHRLGLVGEELRDTERIMDRFFRFHIGLELRSERVLRGILNRERRHADLGSGGMIAAVAPQ